MTKNTFWLVVLFLGFIVSCNNDAEEILEEINEEDTQEEVEEEEDQTEEEVIIKITGYDPTVLRRGYLMSIHGDNFGEILEDVTVNFSSASGETMEAKVISVTNNKIDLAIPVNSTSGNLELFVNDNSITNSVNFAPFEEKRLFSTRKAPFPEPGFYLYYLSYDNDGLLRSKNWSYKNNFSNTIHQLDYSNWDNTFWGLSYKDDLLVYNNGSWKHKRVSGQFNGYANQGVIINTNTNKKYYVDVPAELHDKDEFNLREFNDEGEVISESGIFDLDHKGIVFVPSLNIFVTCEALKTTTGEYELKINRIDASSFDHFSTVVDGTLVGELNSSNRVLPGGTYYDKLNERLLLLIGKNIYSIDLVNNKLEVLVTDLPDKINELFGSDFECCIRAIQNQMIYYEPSNEIFMNVERLSYGATPYFVRVNLASGSVRRSAARFSDDPVLVD